MTIYIPLWVLWLVGVPAVIIILVLAVYGYLVAKALGSGGFWR